MFGLTLDNKEDRKLALPDLLAAMVADGLIKREQQDQLNSSIRPKDLESTHPISLIASFYSMVEHVAASRGINPDAPRHLKKVTETV